MALTFGFYDSINGDRTYNAEQFSRFFDGIISDGVIKAVGSKFQTTSGTGLAVKVGSGRAWFNRTWTYNDSDITVTLPAAHATLPRIDSIILVVDEQARTNSITYKQGTPASTPSAPTLTNTETLHEYRIANVAIAATATSISSADITNVVGTNETPYATLSDMNVDYNTVANRPSINNVILTGNKTTAQLNISYNDLTNKPTYDSLSNRPSINNVTLTGNKTTSQLNISYNDLANKPALKTVATSGSYNDLTNRPTLNGKTITGDMLKDSIAISSSRIKVTETVQVQPGFPIRVNKTLTLPNPASGSAIRKVLIGAGDNAHDIDFGRYKTRSVNNTGWSSMISRYDSNTLYYPQTAISLIVKNQPGVHSLDYNSDDSDPQSYTAYSIGGFASTGDSFTPVLSTRPSASISGEHVTVGVYEIYLDDITSTTGPLSAELFENNIHWPKQGGNNTGYGLGLISSASYLSIEWEFGEIYWEGNVLHYSYYLYSPADSGIDNPTTVTFKFYVVVVE